MYLIIFDSSCIKENREYYLCRENHFDNVISAFPEIKDIQTDNIEEILICSLSNTDLSLSAKTCKCKKLDIKDNCIKVIYENIVDFSENCEQIRKRCFAYLYKEGIKKKGGLAPLIVLVKDYQSFMDIKKNENEIKYKSFMEDISDLKIRHKWCDIIEKFPKEKDIENHEIWDNAYCLNELTYALSKLIEPGYKKIDTLQKEQFEKYFLKTINRCIELEPNSNVHKSILAYHYYVVFMAEHNNKKGYFEKAEKLYQYLIVNSNEKYKELYRYTKLREFNFDLVKWQGREIWIKNVNDIVNDFTKLINDYEDLPEDKQKKYKKEYIGALFGYSRFNLENLLPYYDSYVSNKLFNEPIKEFLFKKERIDSISKIETFLNKIVEIRQFDNSDVSIDLRVKPCYFDVYYRLSQIEQIKGLVYILKGDDLNKSNEFFEKSNEYVKNVLDLAKLKTGQEKFLFPDFVKLIRAINMHFLKRYDDCHRNFFRAKNYMIYEQGVLYCLQYNREAALKVLNLIPAKDNCYNKAQLLIKRIEDEQK